jgi:hypothetical protein
MRSRLSSLAPALALFAAACGVPTAQVPRASVPGIDPVSGALASVEVELPGAEPQLVRGPAGAVVVGAFADAGRLSGYAAPDCPLRRSQSGALFSTSTRCASMLGAYAALEKARSFLLSAGAEALAPALVLADARASAGSLDDDGAGLRYQPSFDAFTLSAGPAGARVPAALNPGAVTREVSRRQLRQLFDGHGAEAEGVALFLGAVASGDPAYLASSQSEGDPRGELDLARPLAAGSAASAVVAGALWAWADASGDPLAASRAALAAARALSAVKGEGASLLSLVAEQLEGPERDQACAVFRARAGRLPACP